MNEYPKITKSLAHAIKFRISLESLFLKYVCGSGSDWFESFNMAAVWFKGVPRWIYLDYKGTVNKLFHKCFTNSASTVHRSHHSHVCTRANHCAPEPITAELTYIHPLHTLRNKLIYTCSGAAGPGFCRRFGPVLFRASKLSVVH